MISATWIAVLVAAPVSTASVASPREALLSGLASADPSVIAHAIEAVRQSPAPLFVDPLRALAEAEYSTLRYGAVRALAELGVPPDPQDLSALLATLIARTQDPDPDVRRAALQALGRFPFPEAEQRLLAIADDPAQADQATAAQALAERSPQEARARMLLYLGATQAERDRRQRGQARSPVDRFGPGVSSLELAARDLLAPDRSRHADAVTQLRQAPRSLAQPFLEYALRSPLVPVRRSAAQALAHPSDPRSAQALQELLADPDLEVRQAALEAQAQSPSPKAARALVERARQETNAKLDRFLARALAAQNDEAVLAAIGSGDGQLSDRAFALILGRVRAATGPRASQALCALLARSHGRRSQAIAESLAERPDEEAVPALLDDLAASPPKDKSRGPVLALLKRRTDPSIGPRAVALIQAGQGDSELAELVAPRIDLALEAQLLTAARHADPRVRNPALQAIGNRRGAAVAAAAEEALRLAPNDRRAYALLLAQAPADRLEAVLHLLEAPELSDLHPALLQLLAEHRDPRIGPAVVATALARPTLARPAIDRLLEQEDPSRLAGLAALAGAQQLASADRAWAVRQLAGPADTQAIELLLPLAADPDAEVKLSARRALHRLEPTTYPEWDPYGRLPLVLEGSALGAAMMVMANQIAGAELSPAFTGGVGLLLGGATPFLLTLDEDVTLGEAAYFGTYGVWGTLAGWGLGNRYFERRQDRLFLTIGGEALGTALGALTMRAAEWGPRDALLTNTTALETALITGGLTALIARNDQARGDRALHYGLVGGALGALPMTFLARHLEVDGAFPLLGTTMAHGALLGGFLPAVLSAEGVGAEEIAAGALAGQGLGYLLGLAWAQLDRPSGTALLDSGLGAGLGLATGGGLALLLPNADPSVRAGLVEAGILGGALTLGLLGPGLELEGNDSVIVALLALGGAWAASDLSVRLAEDRLEADEIGGGLLLGAGLGISTGLALTQALELSDRTLWGGVGGGLVLGAGGVGLSYLWPGLNARERSRISSLAFASGLALTLPFAERLELGPRQWAYASLASATLGVGVALTPSFDTPEGTPLDGARVAGGAALGTTLGLAGGLALAQSLDLSLPQVGIVGGGALATAGIGAGLGLLSPAIERRGTSALLSGGAVLGLATGTLLLQGGWLDSAGGEDRTVEIGSHTGAFILQGALQGSLIPYLRKRSAPPSEEVAGGAMLGAGVGALLGLTVSQALDHPRQPADLLEASLHSGLVLSASGGLAALGVEQRVAAGLAEGLGLASYVTSYALAPSTDYRAVDVPTLILGTGSFGAAAYLAPIALGQTVTAEQRWGAAWLGASVGALAASAYTQLAPARNDLYTAATTFAGTGIGAGLGLLLPTTDQNAAILSEAGWLTGLGLALSLTPAPEYTLGDHLLTSALTLEGTWLGLQLGNLQADPSDRARAGGALLGGGLGLGLGLGLGAWLEPEPEDALEIAAFGTMGSLVGGGLALALPPDHRRTGAGLMEAAGASGLALGALVAQSTEYSMDDLGYAGLSGAAGAYAGSFLPLLWGERSDRARAGGATALGAAGMMAGLLLSEVRPLSASAQVESAFGGMAGGAIGHGLGLLLPGLSTPTRGLLGAGMTLSTYAALSAFAPYSEYDAGDRVLVPLSGALGASFGLTLPILLGRDPAAVTPEERSGGVLVGAGLATLGAAALSQVVTLEPVQVAGGGFAAALGHGLGYGLGLLLPNTTTRSRLSLMSGVGALGLGTGLLLAPALELDESSALAMGLGGTLGAALLTPLPLYAQGPTLSEVESRPLGGAALLGLSSGMIAGLVLDQTLHPDADTLGRAALGAGLGALSGAGLGLTASEDDRAAVGLYQGMAVAGALGLALAPAAPEQDLGDLALGTAYVGYLSWHALGLSLLTNGTNRQAIGLTMSTVGLGAITGRYLTPYLHLELEDVLMLLAGNVWGTWIGGWGGQVLKDRFLELDEGRQGAGLTLLSSAVGSDVGMAATALVVSGLLEVEPARFAVINLVGLTGMMTGMLVASATQDEPLKAGNVIGSLSGLLVGAIVTSFFDWSRTPSWDELLGKKPEAVAAQAAAPSAPTGLPEIEAWFPSAQVQASPEGDPQYLFTVQGLW